MGVLPSVEVTVLQNSLGLKSLGAGDALAIIGPAPLGNVSADTPELYGRATTVKAGHGELGPLTEAAACGLELTGRPVLLVRCATTTAGAVGTIDDDDVTGTAVVTATSGLEPIDDSEPYVEVIAGGDIESGDITYQWSDDGGRTKSPTTALGTGTTITFPGSRGVGFTLDPAAAEVTKLIAFAGEARTDTLAHLADVTVHDAADTSADQVALAASSPPTTAAQAWAVLNLCRAALETHRESIAAHNGPDPVNAISHAAATNSSSGVGLAIEYEDDFHAHLGVALAAGAAGLKAATATSASPVTLTEADLLEAGVALLATYPRRLTFATAGGTAADAPADVVITGTDYLDAAQSETLALAQTASTVTSVKAYKTIVSLAYAAGDGTGATIAVGYGQGVHNSADVTNTIAAAVPAHATLVAGDVWSCTTSAPKPSDAQIVAAMAALSASNLPWKTLLILSPITGSATVSAIQTQLETMAEQYKFKKVFGYFRFPNDGETEAQYLTAFKTIFDSATTYQLQVSAGAVEFQSSAQRPRVYKRPPAWLAAPLRVKNGPAAALHFVNDGLGALPLGASISDASGNPKHHDESLDPGLDAARALTLRSLPGYPGKVFFTRDRTLAALGTDFSIGPNWAVAVEMLDAVIPKLIGRLGGSVQVDTSTGGIAEEEALDIEAVCAASADAAVFSKGWASNPAETDPESKVLVIDRTTNILSDPEIPVTLAYVPLAYIDKFLLTLALKNPRTSNV